MQYRIIHNGPQMVAVAHETFVKSIDELKEWLVAFEEMDGDIKYLSVSEITETPISLTYLRQVVLDPNQ
jgi:hypothetical protein